MAHLIIHIGRLASADSPLVVDDGEWDACDAVGLCGLDERGDVALELVALQERQRL